MLYEGKTVTHKDHKAIRILTPVFDVLRIKLHRFFVEQGE